MKRLSARFAFLCCVLALSAWALAVPAVAAEGDDAGEDTAGEPQEDLERFGYSEEELMAGTLNNAWRALMRFQLERARDWFARSEAGVRWLSADARWPVWTSLRLYRGILDEIERVDYDVFNHRAYVAKVNKLLDLPRSFLLAQSR